MMSAGRIPKMFVQELRSKVNLVELIHSHVPLKKAGQNYVACCPFHQESSPSFTVSPQKHFFHCFGCGAHGDALEFLMRHRRLDFVAAVEALAQHEGVVVPYEQSQASSEEKEQWQKQKMIKDVLAFASLYFQRNLRTPAGAEAVTYLKQRGISGITAKQYAIGVALDAWEGLSLAYRQQGRQDESLLEQAGLRIEKGPKGKGYDRFRHRLMFPIRTVQGHTVGFGGRVMSGAETPKYLNSPETAVFQKRHLLYGLYEALQQDKALKRLYIVEGYMDVVSLAEHGVMGAVATLGTAVTDEHLSLMLKHCKDLIFCFDADAAGQRAAQRAIELLVPRMTAGFQVRFMFLPEGEDPDSFIARHGLEAWQRLVQEAQPFSEALLVGLSQDLDMQSLEGRAMFQNRAMARLAPMQEGIYRDMLMQKVQSLARMPAQEYRKTHQHVQKSMLTEKMQPLAMQLGVLLYHEPHAVEALADVDFLAWESQGLSKKLFEWISYLKTLTFQEREERLYREQDAYAFWNKESLWVQQASEDAFTQARKMRDRLWSQAIKQQVENLLKTAAQRALQTQEQHLLNQLLSLQKELELSKHVH